MSRFRIAMVLALLALGGCSTTAKIVDYDPETQDVFRPESGSADIYQPTEDWIIAAEEDNVSVEVIKSDSFYDEQHEVDLQRWIVLVTNRNKVEKCVGVLWRLLDFQFISEHPTTVLIPEETVMQLGTMQGQIMMIDGVAVAPPPSGYVHEMQVLKPDYEAPQGEECLFLDEEENILDQKGVKEPKEPKYIPQTIRQ